MTTRVTSDPIYLTTARSSISNCRKPFSTVVSSGVLSSIARIKRVATRKQHFRLYTAKYKDRGAAVWKKEMCFGEWTSHKKRRNET